MTTTYCIYPKHWPFPFWFGGIASAGIWESEYLIWESSIIAICPISYEIFTVLEVGSTECKRHLPDLWAKILQLFLSSGFLLCSLAHSLVQTLLVHSTRNLGLILDSSLFSPCLWKQYHKPTRHIINLWLNSQYVFTLLPLLLPFTFTVIGLCHVVYVMPSLFLACVIAVMS